MAKHLQRDLDDLKRRILDLGALVEASINDALRAYIDDEIDLIESVIERDHVIDQNELEVEDDCMKILALHQPVAADLRFVVTVLKVNNDLERMGDLGVTIAKRSRIKERKRDHVALVDFGHMREAVVGMVRDALDSLVKLDCDKARAVCAGDQVVDDIHKANYKALRKKMEAEPANVNAGVNALSVSRALERIADLATNIAEDVVFQAEGEVIRHGGGIETDYEEKPE